MPRFHTVIPLHNLKLDPQGQWKFAGGLVLTALPTWVRTESMLADLNKWDRRGIDAATHAFVAVYEAASLGHPDPAWKRPNPKSIQESKYEVGVLANLALWLSRPCPVCFTIVLHAPEFPSRPIVHRITSHSPLLCHPRDMSGRITADDLAVAAKLHSSLVDIGRDNAMWTAVRATWAGLQMNIEPIRYLLFWVALEALFGPEDGREITYRLSQRVAFFLGRDRTEARQLFATAKKGYGARSKIVHGQWNPDDDGEERMAEAECLVRQSLTRILEDSDLTKKFSEKGRERFLDDLVFENGEA